MCTLALYQQVFDGFPIVVAANRDEHYDRPSAAPAFLCHDPVILAGRDLRAGGTWLGVNQHGLVVGILNRRSTSGAVTRSKLRSRGLLCLDLLKLPSLKQVRLALGTIDPAEYQPFTVVCVDQNNAFSGRNIEKQILTEDLARGLHVFSSSSEFDVQSAKADRAFSLFAKISENAVHEFEPVNHVARLAYVLADHTCSEASRDPRDAVCVHGELSGTVSSSIIFYSDVARQMHTYYCADRPCQAKFTRLPDVGVRQSIQ